MQIEAKRANIEAGRSMRLELPDITKRLERALDGLPQLDVVVGVATGGTVLAGLAAHKLGLPLRLLHINYRAGDNAPQREAPEVLAGVTLRGRQRVLLVDDVSVTGATLRAATALLSAHEVTTLTLKGRADATLYPEVTRCILLPWRD